MKSPSSVTIIVTPRERFSVARRAFESVAANTPGDHRFLYVAGGAPPTVRRFLQEACAKPNYDLILTPDFLAPNVARNLGLARAATKYVVFLDNDVVVEPGWIDALVRCAEEEEADIVSPLCLIGEPAELNLHSLGGQLIMENKNGKIWLRERHHFGPISLRGNPKSLTRLSSDYSEFHCALVRRSVFERMGSLDENITGSAEHIDLALHLRALGCCGFAEPAAVVSYIPIDYTLADLDPYTIRWSSDWHFPTMAHLAEKWNLAPNSGLISDYRSDFYQKRERCLLRLELPRSALPAAAENLKVAQTIVQLLDQMEALGYEPEALAKVRDAYMVAAHLFAASFRGSGRTFLAHLVGTGSILAAYGANPTVVAAALLHAAYAQGKFPEGFDNSIAAMRRWLRRRVGEPVETLVFMYSCLHLDSVAQYLPDLDDMTVKLANSILIRIANGVEDRICGDHRYFDSADWLRDSNDLIELWTPIFTAVANRLGFGAMAAILRELATKGETTEPSPRPVRPPNFTIKAGSDAMRPLNSRNIVQNDGREPAMVFGGSRRAIDLDAITAMNEGAVARESGCVRIDAAPAPWAYSANLKLHKLINRTGPAMIEIRLQVERGEIGVFVLERGSWVYMVGPEQSVASGSELSTLRFEIPAIEEVGDMVFRGWPRDDSVARAKILEISLVSDRAARFSVSRLARALTRLLRRPA